eukprot:5893474-Alexandrium_andersonii.AAC.1
MGRPVPPPAAAREPFGRLSGVCGLDMFFMCEIRFARQPTGRHSDSDSSAQHTAVGELRRTG